jgi:hypothetical protein
MERIRDQIARRAATIAGHPLYGWIAGVSDADVPLDERFRFAPLFVTYIMGFSDMNKWFMRYPAPATELERAITEHTYEDQTHSRLFLEDWQRLGLDARLDWSPSRTLEWYFAAPETEIFREYGMEITRMCVRHPDARIRYAFMEAIETCGHVFFGVTAPVAERLSAGTGIEYRYFGPHHLRRETGHLQARDHAGASPMLDGEVEAIAAALVDRIFDMFEIENDRLLAYARRGGPAEVPDSPPQRTAGARLASEGLLPAAHRSAARPRALVEAVAARRHATAAHPLFRWLREARELPVTPLLRELALIWTPDVMGYKDLNRHALTYPYPATAAERAVNRWTAGLQSHHRLFLADWHALELDAWLGWSASETLRFFCVAAETETQRRNMATFVQLAHRHVDPGLRGWLIEALEATGEPFFAATQRLAARFEAETGRRLDYLGGRHERVDPERGEDVEADAIDLCALPLSARQHDEARSIIETVFDKIDEQYTLTLERLR